MKVYLVKTFNGGFIPADDEDKEKLKGIKQGETVSCEVKKPRNIKFHRKFFVLVKLVYDNQKIYKCIEHLRNDLTIEAGYYKVSYNMHGEEVKLAKSISFASMGELEFNEFYSSVVNTICTHFNFDKQTLINEVAQYF